MSGPKINNRIGIYTGPRWDGSSLPPGETLLSIFLDQVGMRLHAYFEVYIEEELSRRGPRPADLWAIFDCRNGTFFIYVTRISLLGWVRKLFAALDDPSVEDALGRSGLVFAASRTGPHSRSILLIDGTYRTGRADIQRAAERAAGCLRHHLRLDTDDGTFRMLWSGQPPVGAPEP